MSSRRSSAFNAAVGPQAVGQLVTVIASLGSTVVLAHVMPTPEYGAFLAVWAFMTLSASLVRLGMKASLQREVPLLTATARHTQANALIRAAWWLIALSIAVTAPIISTAVVLIIPGLSFDSPEVWLIVLITGGEALRTVGETILRALSMPTAAQVTGSPLRGTLFFASCLIPVAFEGQWGLTPVLVALLAANTLTALIQFGSSRAIRGRASRRGPLTGGMIHLARLAPRFILLDVTAIVLSQGDILIAAQTLTGGGVANYGIAVRLVTILAMPAVVVGTALAPKLSYLVAAGADAELHSLVKRSSITTCLVTLAGAIAFAVVGRHFLPVVFGSGFQGSYSLTLILAVGVVINSLFQLSGWLLVSVGRERSVFWVMSTTSIAELVIGYWLSAHHGASALAAASSSASFIQSGILTYWYLHTHQVISSGTGRAKRIVR